jgi:predicted RNA methylase
MLARPMRSVARKPKPCPREVAAALRSGTCPDDSWFDQFLPDDLRVVAGRYFTPLEVAARVAGWLDELGARTVVDIGAGAGKLCVAAALRGRCHFVGLEQRPRLVSAAEALTRLFEVDDRVSFRVGALGATGVPPADAYYCYNPFGENLFARSERLDHDVELSAARYRRDVAAAEALFRQAPVGTFVLTYNGFGGRLPGYEVVHVDRELPNLLRLWRKAPAR